MIRLQNRGYVRLTQYIHHGSGVGGLRIRKDFVVEYADLIEFYDDE